MSDLLRCKFSFIESLCHLSKVDIVTPILQTKGVRCQRGRAGGPRSHSYRTGGQTWNELCHCFFAVALLSSRFHWSFSRIDFTVTLEDGAKAVLRRGLPADDNSSFTLAFSREGRDKALFSASWWGCDSAPSPGRLEHTALAEVCVLSLRAVDGLHASLVCHRYCSQYGVFRCRFRGSLGIIVF